MATIVGLRERGKEQRRARIVAAARSLIVETGEASLTMRALADRAQVSLATPYNLFGSRNAILVTILEDDGVRFARSMAAMSSANELERIFDTVDLAQAYYTAEPSFYRAIFAEVFLSQSEVRPSFAQQRRAIWETLVADAVTAGYIDRAVDPGLLRDVLTMHFAAAITDWIRGTLPFEALGIHVKAGFAIILKGVATRRSSAALSQHLQAHQAALTALTAQRKPEPAVGDAEPAERRG